MKGRRAGALPLLGLQQVERQMRQLICWKIDLGVARKVRQTWLDIT